MANVTLASETAASRLKRQEEDIRWLWAEVQRLRVVLQDAPDRWPAEGPSQGRKVAQLQAENRHLRYRLDRLRMSFGEELIYQAKEAAMAAAAGALTLAAQPPPGQSQEEDTEKKEEKEEKEEKEGEEEELSAEVMKQRDFIQDSMRLFETLKKDRQLLFSIRQKEGNTEKVISVVVADGNTVQGELWKSPPPRMVSEIW